MNTLTQIVNYIKDMNTQQWFDILMAIWIVIIFKLFSSLFSYLILKIFNIHKKKAEIKVEAFLNDSGYIFDKDTDWLEEIELYKVTYGVEIWLTE